jgi:transporter family-2 protein
MSSRRQVIAWSAVGVAIGMVVAVQARINGQLAADVGDPVAAAALGFVLGWLLLTLVVLVRAHHRDAVRRLPGEVRARRLPAWALFGGIGGAFLVFSQGYAVPALGVALFTVALVAGQTGSSLEVDRLGLGPRGRIHPSRARVLAAVLAVVAVLVAVDPFAGRLDVAPLAILVCLLAGFGVSLQQAFNGRVAQAGGSPVAAAWVNFSVGGVLLWTATFARGLDLSTAPDPLTSPWLYTGGALGAVFVVTAAWLVRVLGVLLLTLTTIAGQLLGAVVVDVVVPTPGRPVTAVELAGVALTFVAVAVGSGVVRRRAVR